MAVLRHPGWTTVTVTVRYFAGAQAAAGTPEEGVTLTAPATLGTLLDDLVSRHGDGLARVLSAASFIVDEVAVTGAAREATLDDGTCIDVLPPFAGG